MINRQAMQNALPWIVGAIAIVMLYSAWRDASADRTRVEAELEIKNKIITELRVERATIDKGMEQRNKELDRVRKDFDELKRRPLPVREIVKEMAVYLPLPGTPEVIENRNSKIENGESPTPDTRKLEPSLLFNPDQVKGLRAFYLDCHQKAAELTACGEDKTDLFTKQANYQKELRLLMEERDSAVKAMRGGGVWQRFKRNAKWFLIGGAVGAGAAAATR